MHLAVSRGRCQGKVEERQEEVTEWQTGRSVMSLCPKDRAMGWLMDRGRWQSRRDPRKDTPLREISPLPAVSRRTGTCPRQSGRNDRGLAVSLPSCRRRWRHLSASVWGGRLPRPCGPRKDEEGRRLPRVSHSGHCARRTAVGASWVRLRSSRGNLVRPAWALA
jgi:hypothetical protein